MIAIVGTTIAPWQLFFQQSCIADKRLRFADLKWARLDTFLGACVTILVAGCMMMAGNGLPARTGSTSPIRRRWRWISARSSGPVMRNVHPAADDQRGGAGHYGDLAVQRLGLRRSAGLAAQPAEGRDARRPAFTRVYVLCVAAAAGIVLIPRAPLQLIILERAGAGGRDAAVGDHLPAASVER